MTRLPPALKTTVLITSSATTLTLAAVASSVHMVGRNSSAFAVWLTDAHLDPYYGTSLQQCFSYNTSTTSALPYGVMGCDPPFSLLESAATAASRVAAEVGAEFVIYTGDFARHRVSSMPQPSDNVTHIISDATQLLLKHFPSIPVVPAMITGTLGNNDVPRDYYLNITTQDASNPWLSRLGQTFSELAAIPEAALASYSYGGFYEHTLGPVTLLILNTLAYSRFHVPQENGTLPADPFNQFKWLDERLMLAARSKRHVWIIGHIPPGNETFGFTELWHPQYVSTYLGIVSHPQCAPYIAAQLFGHVHADEFRLLPGPPTGTGPMLLSGSVSPVYMNNPSFRLLEFDRATGRLLNFQVYWARLDAQGSGKGVAEGSEDSDGSDGSDGSDSSDGRGRQGRGSAPRWRFGYDAASTFAPLRAAREAGALTNAAFHELATVLAQGGDEWDTFVSWYKTQVMNDLQQCKTPALPHRLRGGHQGCIDQYLSAVRLRKDTQSPTDVAGPVLGLASKGGADQELAIEDFYSAARSAHWRDARGS